MFITKTTTKPINIINAIIKKGKLIDQYTTSFLPFDIITVILLKKTQHALCIRYDDLNFTFGSFSLFYMFCSIYNALSLVNNTTVSLSIVIVVLYILVIYYCYAFY